MSTRYRLTFTLLLTTLLSGGIATAGVTVGGSVYGGGNLADVQTNATVNIKAGDIEGDVFGGGKGQVTVVKGDVTVNIGTGPDGEGKYSGAGLIEGSVYGGSALGAVNATKDNDWDEDHLDRIKLTTGKSTAVNIFKGTVNGSVYGGGLGQKTGIDQATSDIAAVVFGNTTVTVGASDASATPSIDMSVYGGSNVNGVSRNDVTVNIIRGTIGKSTIQNEVTTITGGNVHGGGFGQYTLVNGSVHVNIGARVEEAQSYTYTGFATIYGDVYGGSAKGIVNAYIDTQDNNLFKLTSDAHTDVNLYGIDKVGDIYGGGLGDNTQGSEIAADVYGPVTVTVKGGSTRNVFGGNNKYGEPKSSVIVYIDGTDTPTQPALYSIENVYGGGNLAHNTTSPIVNVQGQSYVLNVFGGGNQASINTSNVTINTHATNSYIDKVFGGGNEADITGNTVVLMTGGRVLTALYGGCNAEGTVGGDASVSITGGTVGAGTIEGTTITYSNNKRANVHGGGFGPATYVTGSVAVTINSTPVIWGDVYGGSAQGHVNAYYDNDNGIQFSTNETTQVNLLGGTISGDAYGGGLGTLAVGQTPAHPAFVGGNVTVQLNGTKFNIGYESYSEGNETVYVPVSGRIFGCNNVNGTPKRHVTVNVSRTVQGNVAWTDASDLLDNTATHTYHLAAVYGGGNEAAYEPISDNEYAEVNIDGCELTSIEQVYGGGNAATVPATQLTINGTYEIAEAFGGGNGKYKLHHGDSWVENHGAHVGFKDYGDADWNTRHTNTYMYGTGQAVVNIYGGLIHSVYGGSNTKGNVRDATVTMLEEKTQAGVAKCALKVDEVYGGGRSAAMDGKAIMNIGCIPGIGTLYGGSRAADVYNDVELNITNGTYNKIYGGNNELGHIYGTITINIEEVGCRPIVIGELYGGGNEADYSVEDIEKGRNDLNYNDPTDANYYKNFPKINVISATSIGKVFGGGDNADVIGNPHVKIAMVAGVLNSNDNVENNEVTQSLGTITQVFGGGNNAGVTGDTYVDILGGNISSGIYGGSNTYGTITGNTHVTLTGADIGTAQSNAEVYGGGLGQGTSVTGTTYVSLGAETSTPGTYTGTTTMYGNLYGGSAFGSVANTQVDIYAASSFTGNVFGGSKGQLDNDPDDGVNEAISPTVTSARTNLYAGTVGNIYGGCNDNGTTTTANVYLYGGNVTNVFGSGKGHSTTTTTATVYVGTDSNTGSTTIGGDVYGGSELGAVGTSIVNLNKATSISGDVFGGGQGSGSGAATAATVTTSATVNLNSLNMSSKNIYGGCNVNGTAATTTVNVLGGSVYDVFGGGLGNNTGVTGNVTVSIGTYQNSTATGNATVMHEVYGGSAKGSVNTDTNNTTTVNLWSGTINGDVYGGGLGDNQYAAAVNGNVIVNLNGYDNNGTPVTQATGACVVKGSIFGCNNANGSPQGIAEVRIYNTAGYTDHTRTLPANLASATASDHSYELAAVYGGGNRAAFTGTTTKVIIESCDPSIEYVYGGGNAADATETYVEVNGAYEIGTVFGGGNGSGNNNPGANVTGTATSKLYGGLIHEFFGGSNAKGDIGQYENNVATGGTDITIDDHQLNLNDGCSLKLDNIYGAGKSADVNGNVKMTMGCLSSSNTISNLFGGAQAADISGDVILTVTSGTFTNVFGGNDASGHIGGSITVNVEETGCQALSITNVYGGGRDASYTGNPTVNLKSFTSVGNVFGGGYGSTATVHGNPTVNINQTYGDHTTSSIGTISNVFGGGEQANVEGNTEINIGTLSTVQYASITDDPSTPADDRIKNVIGVNITNNVYGGGKNADVIGNTKITIGTVDLSGNTVIAGNVFGGGLGETTKVTGNVEVNIGDDLGTLPAHNYVGYAQITGDVYGGSAKGTVNAYDNASVLTHTTNATTQVNLYGGTVNNLYGGGYGKDPENALSPTLYDADVYGPVTVTVYGGQAANVYGCNNIDGAPLDAVSVNINGGNITNRVFGGGNLADYGGSPTVTIAGGISNYVFGGGNEADVAGSITVNVTGGTVTNDVYGGGALANTNTANWNNGTWAAGMNNENTGTTYKTTLNLTGGTIGNAYGGGLGRLVKGSVGDPGYISPVEAMVYGDVSITVNGTAFTMDETTATIYDGETVIEKDENVPLHGRVFGANNLNGSPKGNITVTVESTRRINGQSHVSGEYEMQAVYGGGNLADYSPASGKITKVIIRGCDDTSIEKVYGGGNSASVPATDVTIWGSYELGFVFGGGNGGDKIEKNGVWQESDGASVTGQAKVTLKGGTIHSVFGGSDTKGTCGSTLLDDSHPEGGCPLRIVNFYGGGKSADVNHDVVIEIAGCSSDDIEYIYGGSYDAKIKGGITLTITSGILKNVYGGNDHGGSVGGDITVNIEETDNCKPIIIKNLYGGGNQAAYPGTGATDGNGNPITSGKITVNIKSCTRIDNVYGGSHDATVNGSTEVNINMTKGRMTTVQGVVTIPSTYDGDSIPNITNGVIDDAIGTIGNVFGGGDNGVVTGDAVVNIGTSDKVYYVTEPVHFRTNSSIPLEPVESGTYQGMYEATVEGANITGNVYGGGNLANVLGNTYVNICATKSGNDYLAVAEGTSKVSIAGNVFGGGKGLDDNFYCNRAMIGIDGAGADKVNYPNGYPNGNTHVNIGNGTVNGTVYGGGEIGRVEMNTTVLIGFGNGTTDASKPEIKGNVFGGGKGVETHGYSALVRGNPTVTIEGKAKVRGSVYGGGEIASVARYNVKTDPNDPNAPTGWPMNMPYALKDANSGFCTVTIQGYAEIGPDAPMKMKKENGDGPDDLGHVFGAGKGIIPKEYTYADDAHKPKRMVLNNDKTASIWEYFSNEANYIQFIETLALASETEVEITGNAFVKGSVYGGSENGIVQYNTHVTIAGDCQIGAGENINRRYTLAEWSSESLAECAHWDYAAPYAPHDLYNDSNNDGKPDAATDGHTFYGNVFGGGSGYYPYRRKSAALDGAAWVKDNDKSTELGRPVDENGYSDGVWLNSAGVVRGNTVVDILGGHILTSVYGGNEQTDVKGSCTINMSGGTLGVPRTLEQIALHPVTCYLFGAGKGDTRVNFNTWTNVGSVDVNITGGKIFGSVFGGGEDGHVLGDVTVDISSGAKIGTTGTSYVDGNVFGGGRGFSGDAQTAGTVGGNITVTITGGEMLGSIYGGGRLASVGTQFANPESPDYGNFVEDNVAIYYSQAECDQLNTAVPGFIPAGTALTDAQATAYNAVTGATKTEGATLSESEANEYNSKLPGYLTTESVKTPATRHGHVIIDISGGTIGNKNATGDGAVHSGNVFGGSMGRLDLLNGTRNPIWPKLAQVKTSTVNIYGNAEIVRSVYGGGEFGTVRDKAYVTIGGYKTPGGVVNAQGEVPVTPVASDNLVINRDVFGGGYGSEDTLYTVFTVKEPDPNNSSQYIDNTYAFSPMQFAGCVGQNTYVTIVGGYVRKSVYGGGELASVGIMNCLVETLPAKPGKDRIVVKPNTNMVYKSMRRHWDDTESFTLSWPYEFENFTLYPGDTYINITGGRIGTTTSDDYGTDNGDIYGGGKGIAGDYKDYVFCANVGNTHINIQYPLSNTATPSNYMASKVDCIAGAVYGGGENGHVLGDTKISLANGLIGHALYGGGSGKGQFKKWLKESPNVSNVTNNSPSQSVTSPRTNNQNEYEATCYSITAGKVFGNTEIEMTGGYVIRNVYGGGTLGSVGKGNYAGGPDDFTTAGYGEKLTSANLWDDDINNTFSYAFLHSGKCTVKILGGTVGYYGVKDSLPYGNVFGGCRGASAPNIVESPRYLYSPEFYLGYVNETEVIIGQVGTVGPTILGSVYGGGQDGHVRRDANVTINSGKIGLEYNTENRKLVGTLPASPTADQIADHSDLDDLKWLHRGNVYGAGSGISDYSYDFNYDGDYLDEVDYRNPNRGTTSRVKETGKSSSAGSVTRFTNVTINGGTIYRNVYGGGSLASIGAPSMGQPGEVLRKGDGNNPGKQSLNEVVIKGGQIGGSYSYDQDDNHVYGGYVFGASRGQEDVPSTLFATSLWTSVNIYGGTIYADVFGGGEIGIVMQGVDVNMLGGTIKHSIYGGGALANTNTKNWDPEGGTDHKGDWKDGWITKTGKRVTTYNTKLNLLGGTIGGEAYGGGLGRLANGTEGQNGYISAVPAMVYGDITLNLNGLEKAEYEANTELFEDSVTRIDAQNANSDYMVPATKKGAVVHKIFGANNLNGTPKGHIKVHVFATQNKDKTKLSQKWPKHPVQNDKAHINETLGEYLYRVDTTYTALKAPDAVVSAISAAKTANTTYEATSSDANKAALDKAIAEMDSLLNTLYDMTAVYGGGNLAEYVWGNGDTIKKDNTELVAAARTEVIIEGCDYTSIKQVYGGGNAASSSGTFVEVNSSYEIDEVFGGGNGADDYYLIVGTVKKWYDNPGANVGYHNYTELSGAGDGSQTNPYLSTEKQNALSAELRKANFAYGSGIATTDIRGGTIHNVYGGSNKKGNISTTALSVYEEADDDCPIEINETYGGGKDAAMDGEIELSLDCVKEMDMIFGGAKNADIYNNVTLNITNGHYGKVFGGNNTGGALYGTITVNIEEKGCVPIIIDELYGGGYLAPYSKYGYKKDANGNYIYYEVDDNNQYIPQGNGYKIGNIDNGKLVPLEAKSNESQYVHDPQTSNDLRINIISATHIGTIYGGGYKAKVVADPYVNVNMKDGKQQVYEKVINNETKYVDVDYKINHKDDYHPVDALKESYYDEDSIMRYKYFVPLPLGNTGSIYGGGYLADVVGDTHVEIGTGTWVTSWDNNGTPVYTTYSEGVRDKAIITGDVYGGGDNADVTGNTNITVGTTSVIDNPNLKIEHNVYGGGNMGSVGTITGMTKHESLTDGFGLSWPYEFTYADGTGKTTININGGRIGLSGKDWFGKLKKNNDGTIAYKANSKGELLGADGEPIKVNGETVTVPDQSIENLLQTIRKREDNGDIYGGSKGNAGGKENEESPDRYKEALIANVRETEVNINLPTPTDDKIEILASYDWEDEEFKDKMKYALRLIDDISGIAGSVYGGGEDGHVYEDTKVTIYGGYIGHSVYGGGKGKGTYEGTLLKIQGNHDSYSTDVPSITAGRVYGNTYVTMTDGYVMRNIYGGGNEGSVGKGNYSSGLDDYYPAGYGETLQGNLWDNVSDNSQAFLSSGKTKVKVTGGKVGFLMSDNTAIKYTDHTPAGKHIHDDKVSDKNDNYTTLPKKISFKDDLPTGNVFGGSRGKSAPDVGPLSPRYNYAPDFYLGYVNETEVIIGGTSTGPVLLGSVYGGGQDGHVRRDASVTINRGEIGLAFSDANRVLTGTLAKDATDADKAKHADSIDVQWLHRGNVYGSGSGIGKYEYQIDDNKKFDPTVTAQYEINGRTFTISETDYSSSAGSVTRATSVTVRQGVDGTAGNIIYRNVYGGGSLSSVGPPKIGTNYDPYLPTEAGHTTEYGKQTLCKIDIAGFVGYPANHILGYGGNVFGASRGSADLDASTFATVYYTTVNVKDTANVTGNVFGGGETGLVKTNTYVNVSGSINGADASHIGHDLFGGGDQADVLGNTNVTINGGHIMHNVYGGGNMGSVGTITSKTTHKRTPASDGALYNFALSWPVELVYKDGTGTTNVTMNGGRIGTSGDENGDIFGGSKGKIGIDWASKNIDLANTDNTSAVINAIDDYRYEEAEIANVNNTFVTINFASPADLNTVARARKIWDVDDNESKSKIIIDATYVYPQKTENNLEVDNEDLPGHFTAFGETNCVTGSVYGGSEDGHVIGDTKVTVTNGLIGHSIYGGGKGKGTYKGRLYDLQNQGHLTSYVDDIYSLTAGKVYGNTHIIMEDGYVIRSIFGGGNLGSIGKGNYAGGYDDYSTIGYGERPEYSEGDDRKLWESTSAGDMAYNFMNSGKTKVEVRGGQVGAILTNGASISDIEKVARKDGLPTGNVFGACRGQASPNGNVSPRYLYIPDFFLGYVNETEVIIGTDSKQPVIMGSVYGGGQDGHVRRSTNVTINQAEIGIAYSDANKTKLGKNDLTDLQWKGRGNVFGAGSGIGSYTVKNPSNGQPIKSLVPDKKGNYPDSIDYNYSSGSVTCETNVIINEKVAGKTIIHQNVYGGGSLASIGPPNTGQGFAEFNDTANYNRTPAEHLSTSSNNVTVNGGTIGDATSYAAGYGGNIFGASRGNLNNELNLGDVANRYATSLWTDVKVKQGHVFGNVFGGGESGAVTKDTKVEIGGAPQQSGSGAPVRSAAPQPVQAQPTTAQSVQSPTGNASTVAPQNRSVRTNRVDM